MKNSTVLKFFIVGLMVLFILPGAAVAEAPRSSTLGTAFTYQGRLTDGGAPAEGTYDLRFTLYDAVTGGSQVGSTIKKENVLFNEGFFTVQLDFGAVFDGSLRYLEISVRPSGSGAGYAVLSPRQALTAAPNAIYAASAPWSGITGMPAGFADGNDNNTTYTAGDGLALEGTKFKGKGTSYQNVVIVAKSGGDFTSIQAALDSIIDASDGNRYLVYVAPGVYNEQVTMEPFVDIEGAGELTTMITFTGSESDYNGTVVGADNAELRFLTVENTGSDMFATAIYNNSPSPRLTHVTASASGGYYNTGVLNHYSSPTMTNVTARGSGGEYNIGVYNYESSPTMTDVTASGSDGTYNYGVENYFSSVTMTNVTASGSGGTYNYGVENYISSATMTNVTASGSGGTSNYGVYNEASSGSHIVLVNNSHIIGSTNTIFNDSEFIVRVGASQLSGGPVSFGSGTVTCIGVYDENFTSPGYYLCP